MCVCVCVSESESECVCVCERESVCGSVSLSEQVKREPHLIGYKEVEPPTLPRACQTQ